MNEIIAWALSLWRYAKGAWSRIRWLWSHYVKVLLAFASGAVTFACVAIPRGEWKAYLSRPSNYGVCFEAIAVVSLLYSYIAFSVMQRSRLGLDKLDPLGADSVTLRAGEAISQFRGHAILYRVDVNRMLERACNRVRFTNTHFEVHPLVREMLPLFIRRMPEAAWDAWDDAKVRHHTDLSEDLLRRNGAVELQWTSYFKDRLSNTLANYLVRLDGREILNLRDEVLDVRRNLVPLKASALSNQLGASTLLLTSDSTVAFLRQGNRVSENKGRLAPAGSGSFDKPKMGVRTDYTFQQFARDEARRELCEECGLSEREVASIQICGFGRYLYRNGKPEVFCVATTTRTSASIRVPAREWDFQQRTPVFHPFEGELNASNARRGLEVLRSRMEGNEAGFEQASGPLYWSVLFASDYLGQLDGAAEEALFGPLRAPAVG